MNTVTVDSTNRRIRRWIAGASLVILAPVALAGPGFIDSSRVSGDSTSNDFDTAIEVRFNCKAEYLRHEPQGSGDRLRVYLDPTGICNGVSPVVAESRSRLRPFNSDSAGLVDMEYDGDSPAGPMLTFSFDQPVEFEVDMSRVSFGLVVNVRTETNRDAQSVPTTVSPEVSHRQVPRPKQRSPTYVVNLASFQRVPTIADAMGLQAPEDRRLY